MYPSFVLKRSTCKVFKLSKQLETKPDTIFKNCHSGPPSDLLIRLPPEGWNRMTPNSNAPYQTERFLFSSQLSVVSGQ